jgi:hypothetical protein
MDDRERRPDGWVQPAPGSGRRRRVVVWVTVALVGLVVGFGILIFVMSILTYG